MKGKQDYSKCETHKKFVQVVLGEIRDLQISEEEMCKRAKISKGGWSEIRNFHKTPTLATVHKIVKALGIEIEYSYA